MRIVYLTRKCDKGSKTALTDTENIDPIFILNKCGLVFNFWNILPIALIEFMKQTPPVLKHK